MNKDKFVRVYLGSSIAVVLLLMFLQFSFINGLMGDQPYLSGDISVNIFKYTFENVVVTIDMINVPLIMYIVFVVLSVLVAVFALKDEPVSNKLIQDLVVYNGVISILLVVSNIVFMILIPDTVSGILEHSLIMTKIPMQGGEIANVFNFMYSFMIVYIVLNVVILQLTKEKTFKQKKEEQDLDSEFLY